MMQNDYERHNPALLGDYNIMLPIDDYDINSIDSMVTVKKDNKVVLVYPIGERVRQNPELLDHPDSLFIWCNDSLMLVLNSFYVNAKGQAFATTYNSLLFRKTDYGSR